VGLTAVVVTAILAKILLGGKSKKKKNPVALVGKAQVSFLLFYKKKLISKYLR
jgi:hypothetical protein